MPNQKGHSFPTADGWDSQYPRRTPGYIFVHAGDGVRIGEACAVQVQDLDLKMGRILIQRTWSGSKLTETTKQKKKQSVPLSDLAQSVASKNKRETTRGILVINPVTNRGYRDEFLRRLWKEHSGIEITLYEAMRHSTITDWASHGIGL